MNKIKNILENVGMLLFTIGTLTVLVICFILVFDISAWLGISLLGLCLIVIGGFFLEASK